MLSLGVLGGALCVELGGVRRLARLLHPVRHHQHVVRQAVVGPLNLLGLGKLALRNGAPRERLLHLLGEAAAHLPFFVLAHADADVLVVAQLVLERV